MAIMYTKKSVTIRHFMKKSDILTGEVCMSDRFFHFHGAGKSAAQTVIRSLRDMLLPRQSVESALFSQLPLIRRRILRPVCERATVIKRYILRRGSGQWRCLHFHAEMFAGLSRIYGMRTMHAMKRNVIGHLALDILLYWLWGNSADDSAPFTARVLGPLFNR